MSSVQWSEWQAYYNVEPFGHEILFNMFASFISMYANAHKKKGSPSVRAKDIYEVKHLREKQTPDQMKALMMQLVKETENEKPKKAVKKKVRK